MYHDLRALQPPRPNFDPRNFRNYDLHKAAEHAHHLQFVALYLLDKGNRTAHEYLKERARRDCEERARARRVRG